LVAKTCGPARKLTPISTEFIENRPIHTGLFRELQKYIQTMQANNMQTTQKLASVVFSTVLLTSCGAGSGDQNSASNPPEVAQATQAQPQITTPTPGPSAPTLQVTTDTESITTGISATAEQATQTETQAIPAELPEVVTLPESETQTLINTNTLPDGDSDGITVVDTGIPVEPEIIVVEETSNETNGDAAETTDTSGDAEATEQSTDEAPPEPTVHPTDSEAEPEQPQEETSTDSPEPLVTVACTASQADIQTSTLQLINKARAVERMCGGVLFEATTALTWNTKLQDAAQAHSLDMSQNNFFSHDGSDGSTVSQRADTQQYDWRSLGENIAAGQQTTELVVQAWLDSPGHCANLMNPKFKETAVVCVEDDTAQYRQYWTNVLGTSF